MWLFALFVGAERDYHAGVSAALQPYSFDNIGAASATLGSSTAMAAAAADSGRYIQDDLPMTSVFLPDGTAVPLSFVANGSAFTSPGMLDGETLAGLNASYSQPQQMVPTTAQIIDSVINAPMVNSFAGGADSLNLGGTVSGTLTSDELTQLLQSGSVLTEMQSDEFRQEFDGIVFQQMNENAVSRPPQPSEQ